MGRMRVLINDIKQGRDKAQSEVKRDVMSLAAHDHPERLWGEETLRVGGGIRGGGDLEVKFCLDAALNLRLDLLCLPGQPQISPLWIRFAYTAIAGHHHYGFGFDFLFRPKKSPHGEPKTSLLCIWIWEPGSGSGTEKGEAIAASKHVRQSGLESSLGCQGLTSRT